MHRLTMLALVLPFTAQAAWPEDLSISTLANQSQLSQTERADAYDTLVMELGTVLANKPITPAETLGAYGFDISMGVTFGFIRSQGDDGADTPWELSNPTGTAQPSLTVPAITVRKGLPWSIELGATGGWVANSRQGVFGGFARMAPVEGYKPWPDIALQVGYTGYIGNDELELGVLDMGVTVGSTYAFGSLPGIRQAEISPYVNMSLLWFTSAAKLGDDDMASLFGADELLEDKPGRRGYKLQPQFAGGLQITNATILVRLLGTWVPKTIPTLHLGIGFTF